MFTSEGRDGLTQVFVLLVLLFFPSLRQRQREVKEAQGKGNWSRAKKKNYEACDNTHAYFSYYCYRFSLLRMVLCLS